MNIEVTSAAATKMHQLLAAQGMTGKSVRLEVVRTHCMGGRGHEYHLHIEKAPGEDDLPLDSGDLSFVVSRENANLLGNVNIDYVDSFEETGFVISNSHAKGHCPCGHHDLF